ncbi:uncharacterized protein LDX57_010816 [Aspergillus melleus]|uniref:uncharacterized protein n=1 Tax=Aspergillus melleus TaxID=138277 RepID=UPI001E8E3781|nr:uncharacterized protein LDX57_010816 [Aspergillus melleus]KAH8433183.1 hypothetical protein LDX57_010816 [Aspergillus melleus]
MGTVTQLRILGGALGVSICTNILSDTLNRLRDDLPSETMERINQDISIIQTLPAPEQTVIVASLADGYKRQLLMVLGFSAAQLMALALLWEMPLRKL